MHQVASNWHARAACRKTWVGSEWFFPVDDPDVPGRTVYGDDGLRAKLICAACPVIDKCWAENRDAEVGIFAGTDETDRTRMLVRQQRREDRSAVREQRPRQQVTWSDIAAPEMPRMHIARPSTAVQIALYAFLRGNTVRQAAEVAELPDYTTRRAIDQAPRLVS